jgi:hypothetical protein
LEPAEGGLAAAERGQISSSNSGARRGHQLGHAPNYLKKSFFISIL